MSRVIKAVAIGAIIGLTGGLLAPILGPLGIGVPFAQGFLGTTGLLAASLGTAFYAGLGAIATEFLVKKPADTRATQGRLNTSVNPQALGSWVFGETAGATDIVYAEQHGTNDEYATQIIHCASHLITAYGDLHVNDDLIAFTAGAATGDYADALWIQDNLGSEVQTSFGQIDGSDNHSWPADADGLGIAHYRLRWKFGGDKIKSGIPSRITRVMKGAPVYDPRLDTTRGGSGAHRADDQTTWEYTNAGNDIGANWALISLFYLLGWKNNGILEFGVGVDPDDIDMAQAIAAANICDETIDAKKRFIVGGIIPTTNNHSAILGQLEAIVGGKISQVSGLWYIWAPNDDLITFNAITEADIIRDAGIEFIPSAPIEHLYNTARGRYVNPASLYQLEYYPDVVESGAVTEDGRERVMSRDFPMIQERSIAERVARHMIRRTRFSGIWRFSMGPKGLIFRPFDITTITCQETNNLPVEVRIVNMTFDVSGVIQIEALEEDSSIYDTSAALGTAITQLDPNTFDPSLQISVTGFTATAISITGSQGTVRPAYDIGWNDPGPYVARTEIQLKITTDSVWSVIPSAQIDITSAVIFNFEPNTEYDLRIRHVTIFGVFGPYATFTGTTANVGLTDFPDIPHYYYQATAPSGQGEKDNDIWLDSDDNNKRYRRIATVWTDVEGSGDLATIAGDLDDIADGVTFFKSTAVQNTGGTRAEGALDSSKDYIRAIVTTKIVVTGANPTNGLIIDSNGLRGYDGGVQKFNIPITGGALEFKGDIDTDGRVIAEGNSTSPTGNASFVGIPLSSVVAGISCVVTAGTPAGRFNNTNVSSSGAGIVAQTNGTGTGIAAISVHASGRALSAHNAVGDCILISGTGDITGDAQFGDDVIVWGTLLVSGTTTLGVLSSGPITATSTLQAIGTTTLATVNAGAGTFSSTLNVTGTSTLGTVNSGTTSTGALSSSTGTFSSTLKMTSTTANMVIGNATSTGNACLVIKEGIVGSRLNNQILIYGELLGSGKTSLGLVLEEGAESTGTFTQTHRLKIAVNAAEYWLSLDAV